MRNFRLSLISSLLCLLLLSAITEAKWFFIQEPGKRTKDLSKASERASAASKFFNRIMESYGTIPQYIINSASVIAVFSSKSKFPDAAGSETGAGLVSARNPQTGQWGAPIFLTIKGGRVRDFYEPHKLEDLFDDKESGMILIGFNKDVASLFLTEEFELGSDIMVLPGSFASGTTPGTDQPISGPVLLAYLSTYGSVAGVSIEGSTIKQDKDLNDAIYEEKKMDTFLPVSSYIPGSVLDFTKTLNQYCKDHRQ